MSEEIKSLENIHTQVKRDVRERTGGYIATAFGFVIGLAWNDAIRAAIESFYPLGRSGITAKFIYAGAITLIFVSITSYLNYLFKKDKEEEIKNGGDKK